jgi:hypothetical protein
MKNMNLVNIVLLVVPIVVVVNVEGKNAFM